MHDMCSVYAGRSCTYQMVDIDRLAIVDSDQVQICLAYTSLGICCLTGSLESAITVALHAHFNHSNTSYFQLSQPSSAARLIGRQSLVLKLLTKICQVKLSTVMRCIYVLDNACHIDDIRRV